MQLYSAMCENMILHNFLLAMEMHYPSLVPNYVELTAERIKQISVPSAVVCDEKCALRMLFAVQFAGCCSTYIRITNIGRCV